MTGSSGRSRGARITAPKAVSAKAAAFWLLLLATAITSSFAQNGRTRANAGSADGQNAVADGNHGKFECGCMEYWSCVTSGGEAYSYCGIDDSDVCCFVPKNAEPVGILPTPNRNRCGKKGFDSGHEGEADMAEWPWHAAILEKPQDLYVCGSTLLDESWILTAAHCVDD